jgi:hypothetical protein
LLGHAADPFVALDAHGASFDDGHDFSGDRVR